MTKTKNGAACVVDEAGKLVGFFTDGDFRRTMLSDPEAIMRPVSTVMIKEPRTINPGYLASEAAEIMGGSNKKFSQLPVVDENGRLLGMLDDDELIGM
jgi:arabinose-5-phosphate isomerase